MSRSRRLVALAALLTVSLIAGVGGWIAHSYFYDAAFMDVGPGSSTTTVNICSVGQPLYFGYAVTPNRPVHLTGADLVGVPEGVTVEWVDAVNLDGGKYPMLGDGDQDSWAKGGYAAGLHPITDANLPEGGMGDWWLVAKVVPHRTGLLTIQGIQVHFSSGSRSGSAVYPQQAAMNCAHYCRVRLRSPG